MGYTAYPGDKSVGSFRIWCTALLYHRIRWYTLSSVVLVVSSDFATTLGSTLRSRATAPADLEPQKAQRVGVL